MPIKKTEIEVKGFMSSFFLCESESSVPAGIFDVSHFVSSLFQFDLQCPLHSDWRLHRCYLTTGERESGSRSVINHYKVMTVLFDLSDSFYLRCGAAFFLR